MESIMEGELEDDEKEFGGKKDGKKYGWIHGLQLLFLAFNYVLEIPSCYLGVSGVVGA